MMDTSRLPRAAVNSATPSSTGAPRTIPTTPTINTGRASSSASPLASSSSSHTPSSSSLSSAEPQPSHTRQSSLPLLSPSSSVNSSFESALFHRTLSPADHAYVKELTSYSISRLEREPQLIQNSIVDLQKQIESLAIGHYRTFVDTATAVHQTHQAVIEMEAKLGMIEEQLPKFSAVRKQTNNRQYQAASWL